MSEIDVNPSGGDAYTVEVRDQGSATRHTVKVSTSELDRLAGGASAERLVEESFRFLLEREPKEAILREFDISVIARYFPEYPREIGRRLAAE